MKKYNIIVLTGSELVKHTIVADGMMYSQSGVYEFWILNEKGSRVTTACFPVNRTIIEKIEDLV